HLVTTLSRCHCHRPCSLDAVFAVRQRRTDALAQATVRETFSLAKCTRWIRRPAATGAKVRTGAPLCEPAGDVRPWPMMSPLMVVTQGRIVNRERLFASAELRVLLDPTAAFRELAAEAATGIWTLVRRPLLLAFTFGCTVSLQASGRLSVRLIV